MIILKSLYAKLIVGIVLFFLPITGAQSQDSTIPPETQPQTSLETSELEKYDFDVRIRKGSEQHLLQHLFSNTRERYLICLTGPNEDTIDLLISIEDGSVLTGSDMSAAGSCMQVFITSGQFIKAKAGSDGPQFIDISVKRLD